MIQFSFLQASSFYLGGEKSLLIIDVVVAKVVPDFFLICVLIPFAELIAHFLWKIAHMFSCKVL